MRFTWDPEKNRRNLRIHNLTFEKAADVFKDTNNISKPDPYPLEERWRTIGTVEPDILFVVHTWENPGQPHQTIRIITTRRATSRERAEYEQA